MNLKSILLGAILIVSLVLIGCKPDKLSFEIYTSDVKLASSDKVVQVPVDAEFSIPGEDTENLMPKAKNLLNKYLNEDAEIKLSKGQWGDVMVVKCKVPMGSKSMLSSYLENNISPIALEVNNSTISIHKTRYFSSLNDDLSGIHMMLSAQLPAQSTTFRLVGDLKNRPKVKATAVFVDNKAVLKFSKVIDRRESVEIEFKGGSGSVYSQITPHFNLIFN